MSVYGWAWSGDCRLPDKPLERMSMDEALRGLCARTLGDVAACKACAKQCAYALRVLALEAEGIAPTPARRPEPDWKMLHKASVQRVRESIKKRTREQSMADRRARVYKARELIAAGMSMEDAARAVGYKGKDSLKVAMSHTKQEERMVEQ